MTFLADIFDDKASASIAEARKALNSWGIAFEERPDGTLFVPGELNLRQKDLTELPDLTCVSVGGDFNCSWNMLTSLKGAPTNVGGGFYCHKNKLTSLEGAPATVRTNFNCTCNCLKSLKHAPASVGESFVCDFNQLEFLEGAPTVFKELVSDFGRFNSWGSIPVEYRASPETWARQIDALVAETTVAQAPIFIRSPLRLKSAAFLLSL